MRVNQRVRKYWYRLQTVGTSILILELCKCNLYKEERTRVLLENIACDFIMAKARLIELNKMLSIVETAGDPV